MKPFSGEKKNLSQHFLEVEVTLRSSFGLRSKKILWRIRDFLPLSTSPNTPLVIWYSCNQANSLIKEDLVGKSNFLKPHLRVQAFNFWWQLGKISSDRNWRGGGNSPHPNFLRKKSHFYFFIDRLDPRKKMASISFFDIWQSKKSGKKEKEIFCRLRKERSLR